jgi:hypothetical protein
MAHETPKICRDAALLENEASGAMPAKRRGIGGVIF